MIKKPCTCEKIVKKNGPVIILKRCGHFHDNIVAKTVNSAAVIFCLAEVNSKIWDVTVFSSAAIQTFMLYLVNLAGMNCRKERRPLYAIIPSLIDIFFEGSWSLEITQNDVHNSANFEQAIVIIISPLRFLGWIAKMHILADFLKEILCHSLLNSYIANIAIGGPVHGDSWQGIDSHDNTQAKISLQSSFVYVCPLCEPCCWSSQLLSYITVCFFHNEIKNWFSEQQFEEINSFCFDRYWNL